MNAFDDGVNGCGLYCVSGRCAERVLDVDSANGLLVRDLVLTSRPRGLNAELLEHPQREGLDPYTRPAASHSPSFDQRRTSREPFTAIASAFFWPTSTTSFRPRVRPV